MTSSTGNGRHQVVARTIAAASLVATLVVPFVTASPAAAAKTSSKTAAAPPPAPPTLGSMYSVNQQIGAQGLWAQGITGKGVNVAVIDTGVAPVDALTGATKVVAMVDLSAEAGVPEAALVDTFGHGTHMAGIVAGRDPSAVPAAAAQHPEWFLGVAPDAGLVSVKVGDNSGAVDISQVIAGVDWVTDHAAQLNIRVINLSFSSGSVLPYWSDPLTFAVERAWKAGVVVVAAAGNDGTGELRLSVPANDPYVIAVGGVEATSNTSFTVPSWATNGNYLRNPDLATPGAHIESLRNPMSRIDVEHPEGRIDSDPRLFRGSGSSQAAAVASGAAALLLQARPSLSPDQVKAVLKASADATVVPADSSVFTGSGLLRVDRAVAAAVPAKYAQSYLLSSGAGALDKARGAIKIVINGAPLEGEVTVLGTPWVGTSWTSTRWTDGTWDGARWTGGTWMGTRWTGASWTGAAWLGTRWTGASWTGARWTGTSWTGASWTGASWTGTSWTGARWTGTRWTDASWTGATWDGARWTGSSWDGTRWTGNGWS